MVVIHGVLVGKGSDSDITLTCIMENRSVLKSCGEIIDKHQHMHFFTFKTVLV